MKTYAAILLVVVVGPIVSYALGSGLWMIVAIILGALIAAREGAQHKADQQAAAIAQALERRP